MKLDKTKIFERHYEESALIHAEAKEIFSYVDDHANFSVHANVRTYLLA